MEKVRTAPFPPYNPIGEEEARAAYSVVAKGMLSDYIARPGEKFLGGSKVQELERRWAEHHAVKHAVSFNTATSALVAAMGASGVLPGDEVVVMPYSMCISATAPLFYDAVPVFADIEEEFFCMDPASVAAKITPRTRAILTVDLFGQSAEMTALNEIARKHDLKVICDSSHAPGCGYNGGFAGTFGDIGVYSLNQHKIIHCGEGGIAVTNDDDLALRLQLIRNHAEAVVNEMGYRNLTNMLGGNYRLPEVEAAIAIEQLKKLPLLLRQRIELADYLTERLSKLDYLTPPKVREGSEHVYYLYPIRFHEEAAGISRAEFVQRINELGIPLYRFAAGYIKPLYLEPIFAERERFKNGFPYNLLPEGERPDYGKGLCPVTERMHEKELIVTAYNYPPLTRSDMDDIVSAFGKAACR
ncbi:aminotransferase, AHBA_syn family [Citrifermentans bemidjiense Bem]|uniref:Aminotransferase, AHBA_syn family n=1 Tax=Citrifermentans bemidjiense (strain ATCC BAA-1014 / DSM 16622 / JCM 12645 / Bem) TaxID=404380 RepID=B5EDU8_CITBB|nr:DegT/DnrJ/EryC1/StrS family aminotransferase [Citrifermentans bemidjiense]ACH40726.1 aminotransferase, AHBA_syn family [Citrifermentans bemidjiense Bem]